MQKKMLYICSKPPYSSLLGKDCIDSAMVSAAFGQAVSVLFLNDGVFQLLPEKHAEAITLKDHSAAIKALNLYDIEHVYACEQSINQRGLSEALKDQDKLARVSPTDIQQLIRDNNLVLQY